LRAIQLRHEGGLDRHAMRVFDAFRQAFDCHQIASDPGRDVGQIRQRRDDVNLFFGMRLTGEKYHPEDKSAKTTEPLGDHVMFLSHHWLEGKVYSRSLKP